MTFNAQGMSELGSMMARISSFDHERETSTVMRAVRRPVIWPPARLTRTHSNSSPACPSSITDSCQPMLMSA